MVKVLKMQTIKRNNDFVNVIKGGLIDLKDI